jgi:hypothetical protein
LTRDPTHREKQKTTPNELDLDFLAPNAARLAFPFETQNFESFEIGPPDSSPLPKSPDPQEHIPAFKLERQRPISSCRASNDILKLARSKMPKGPTEVSRIFKLAGTEILCVALFAWGGDHMPVLEIEWTLLENLLEQEMAESY